MTLIPILLNISRIKGNQTMRFGQLIEYNKRIFYFKNHVENVAGRLFSDLFLLSKKVLYKVRASGLLLGFTIFR